MGKARDWEQRVGETVKAFNAFVAYRDMGVERSMGKVANSLNMSVANLAKWSRANDWVDRALAFDREHLRQERSALSKRKLSTGRMRARLRQGSYDICKALIPQIKAMLDAPLWEDVIDDVSGARMRVPAKWSKGTIGQLTTALATLSKFALDDGLAEELDFDPVTASPEECRAWAERIRTKLSESRGLQ